MEMTNKKPTALAGTETAVLTTELCISTHAELESAKVIFKLKGSCGGVLCSDCPLEAENCDHVPFNYAIVKTLLGR